MGGCLLKPQSKLLPHAKASIVSKGKFLFVKEGTSVQIIKCDNAKIKKTLLIAFGQSKMFDRPVVGFLHLIVYVAFLLINIELLEIIIDGVKLELSSEYDISVPAAKVIPRNI